MEKQEKNDGLSKTIIEAYEKGKAKYPTATVAVQYGGLFYFLKEDAQLVADTCKWPLMHMTGSSFESFTTRVCLVPKSKQNELSLALYREKILLVYETAKSKKEVA